MAQPQATRTGTSDYAPPPVDGDFYRIARVLNDEERALLKRVREFTEGVVAPVIEDYWARDEFPFAIIPKMAEVGIGGIGLKGLRVPGDFAPKTVSDIAKVIGFGERAGVIERAGGGCAGFARVNPFLVVAEAIGCAGLDDEIGHTRQTAPGVEGHR